MRAATIDDNSASRGGRGGRSVVDFSPDAAAATAADDSGLRAPTTGGMDSPEGDRGWGATR